MIYKEDNIHIGLEKLGGYAYRNLAAKGAAGEAKKKLKKLFSPAETPDEIAGSSLRDTLLDVGIPKTDPDVMKATKQRDELAKQNPEHKLRKKRINEDIMEAQPGLMDGSRHLITMTGPDWFKLPKWRRGEIRHRNRQWQRHKSSPKKVQSAVKRHRDMVEAMNTGQGISGARRFLTNLKQGDPMMQRQSPLRRKQNRAFLAATKANPLGSKRKETAQSILEKLLEKDLPKLRKEGK